MGIGGKIKLEEGTAGGTYVGFKAPDTEVTSDRIWSLPDADGTAGQLMATDGALNLYWTNVDVGTETTARTNADSTLTANLNSEITSRLNSDSTLTANLNSEISARMNADSTLQSLIPAALNVYAISSDSALAVNDRVLANTSAAVVTGTLPASPNSGNEIQILDARGTFGTYAYTLARNGKLINGIDNDFDCADSGKMYRAVFIDNTYGWAIY